MKVSNIQGMEKLGIAIDAKFSFDLGKNDFNKSDWGNICFNPKYLENKRSDVDKWFKMSHEDNDQIESSKVKPVKIMDFKESKLIIANIGGELDKVLLENKKKIRFSKLDKPNLNYQNPSCKAQFVDNSSNSSKVSLKAPELKKIPPNKPNPQNNNSENINKVKVKPIKKANIVNNRKPLYPANKNLNNQAKKSANQRSISPIQNIVVPKTDKENLIPNYDKKQEANIICSKKMANKENNQSSIQNVKKWNLPNKPFTNKTNLWNTFSQPSNTFSENLPKGKGFNKTQNSLNTSQQSFSSANSSTNRISSYEPKIHPKEAYKKVIIMNLLIV